MLSLRKVAARHEPFAHLMQDDFVEPVAYRQLLRDFPPCPPGSGPTGFSCFWGDPDFDRLLERSAAWRALFETVQSQAFVTDAISAFADVFSRESVIDMDSPRFVRYLETREEKEGRTLPSDSRDPDDVFVRLDVLQGRLGYARAPHLDHRRRAISMLIYFCDAEESAMEGGDLILHYPDRRKTLSYRPKHNRMVMFPCSNASVHSVSPILAQSSPRNFVQIAVSGFSDLWRPAPFAQRAVAAVGNRARNALRGARRRLIGHG